MPLRIAFVCLGNICRSPTAEAVMRHRVTEAGLEEVILIESAGTGSWHAGSGPDARAQAEALARGIPMGGRARQFEVSDFDRLDLVLAMDEQNAADLRELAPHSAAAAKVRLLREFDPAAAAAGDLSVPDPYYGGPEGFTRVFAMVNAAAVGLLAHLRDGAARPGVTPAEDVLAALAAATGSAVAGAEPVGGGSINRALRATLADGRRVFVKHHPDAPPGSFRAEADGLAWLAEAGALRTPAVVAVGEGPGPRFLALEWIERGPAGEGAHERFGRGLAALHRAAPGAFGLDADNAIGGLPQPNGPCGDWPTFYGRRRLAPMGRRAVEAGHLPEAFLDRLARLCDRLPELCGPPEPPARLHGDLWSGNAIVDARGGPAVVDPAVYGGHREMDLAMMRLFGGFAPRTFAAYAEAHPLAPGHGERVELWQLYPVLVHVCLFGGGYARQAEGILTRYL